MLHHRRTEASVLALCVISAGGLIAQPNTIRHLIEGNYELNLQISGPSATVFFSQREHATNRVQLEITNGSFQLVRKDGDDRTLLKTYNGNGNTPWKVYLLKKGNFFIYRVNSVSGWIREPLGPWKTDDLVKGSEPFRAYVGAETPDPGRILSFTATLLPWLQQITTPVIRAGPDGTFKEGHVLAGPVISYQGVYYMYFSGARFGCQEGGGAREIGVASSRDLREWTVAPEPILRIGAKNSWEPTGLYCSGAVVMPDGKIAVMYAAQNFPLWGGFGVAFADSPAGPFKKYGLNPVYKFISHAHEFDLVRTDQPGRRYLMFFSGFTEHPRSGKAGDRGYILYSNDLIHWESDSRNPVFGPETLDGWDAIHVRPRSLNKIGDTWYLWYEGANDWAPPEKALGDVDPPRWWDTIGLARSKDLINWEYYPRNPALPGLGIGKEQFDSGWVGWPRMFIRDEIGYIFYTGGRNIGLRTIPIRQLTNWSSEGGRTIDLLGPARASKTPKNQEAHP